MGVNQRNQVFAPELFPGWDLEELAREVFDSPPQHQPVVLRLRQPPRELAHLLLPGITPPHASRTRVVAARPPAQASDAHQPVNRVVHAP